MNMSMRDLKILTILNVTGVTTPYIAIPFDEIGELYLSKSKAAMSESTIRRSLKTLIDNGYVENGYKRGNIKTYYISGLGVKLLSEIK